VHLPAILTKSTISERLPTDSRPIHDRFTAFPANTELANGLANFEKIGAAAPPPPGGIAAAAGASSTAPCASVRLPLQVAPGSGRVPLPPANQCTSWGQAGVRVVVLGLTVRAQVVSSPARSWHGP
jgi:hypothetical protein